LNDYLLWNWIKNNDTHFLATFSTVKVVHLF
jgi:hypothetical protein